MPDVKHERRTVLHLRPATKVCVMIAAVLIIAALYFYYTPVLLTTADGSMFGCGSAAHPPSDPLPKAACLNAPTVNLYRAIALLASGVVVVLLGWFLFGADRTTEDRVVAGEDDEFDAR